MAGNQKRLGSNLTDDELEDIKRAVRDDPVVWEHFLRYCIVGFIEGSDERAAFFRLAEQARPDSNLSAKGVAAGDLRDEAARAQGLDPLEAEQEHMRLVLESSTTGWRYPADPMDLNALLRKRIDVQKNAKDRPK